MWDYSSLHPSEVLRALERRIRGGALVPVGGGGRLVSNEAVHQKALEALPFFVSAAARVQVSGTIERGGGDGEGGRGDVFREDRELGANGSDLVGVEEGKGEGGAGGRDDDRVAGKTSLADAALEFLSAEMSSISAAVTTARSRHFTVEEPPDRGKSARRRAALARTLLDVLEGCYRQSTDAGGGTGGGAGVNSRGRDDGNDSHTSRRRTGPESWPWNSGAAGLDTSLPTVVESAIGRPEKPGGVAGVAGTDRRRRQLQRDCFWPPLWPVRSLPRWGPLLADTAGDRMGVGRKNSGRGGGGGGAAGISLVAERAAEVIELVLREHAGAAWRKALFALRPRRASGGSMACRAKAGSHALEEEEREVEVLPLCEPLLERICLDLPLMDLPVRVHAAVFEAHGWLALLPCGIFFLLFWLEGALFDLWARLIEYRLIGVYVWQFEVDMCSLGVRAAAVSSQNSCWSREIPITL